MTMPSVRRTIDRSIRRPIRALLLFFVVATVPVATAAPPGFPAAEDWTEQRVLDPAGEAYDNLGVAVALSGPIALVSSPGATIDGNASQGKVLVYERAADGQWNLIQTLIASDGAAYNQFGWSVAIADRIAVVGAINASIGTNNSQGAAYVFTQGDDGTWTETQKLVASDGMPVDWFGNAVTVSDDMIIVAAYGAHYNDQLMRGSVYVFTQVGGVWTQTQQLVAADGAVGGGFGYALARSGPHLLVSSPGAEIDGRHNQGAVYRFALADGVWQQAQKIVVSEGLENDQLGSSLAIDGATALIGAMWRQGGQGVAYVFADDGAGAWAQVQRLSAADGAAERPDGIGVPPSDNFGMTVALQGDTAIVGASNVTIGANAGQGAAYLFRRSAGVLAGTHTFTKYEGVVSPYFGAAVALDGDAVLVGVFGYTPDWDHYQQGAAYFYRRAAGIPASERAALVDLYDSTNGADWWDMSGWLGAPGTECSWSGVTCDAAGTRVVGLTFSFSNMVGTLPASLGQLTHLTSLQISDQGQLTGAFPSLAAMKGLESIDIRNTGLDGSLPSLAGLTRLQAASFLNNRFTGSIPPFGELPALSWYSVAANQLSGFIPSLAGVPSLTGFFVSGNALRGPLPVPPVGLGPGSAELCPNALDHVASPEWDAITGVTPWYRDCTATPLDVIFDDGFDGD